MSVWFTGASTDDKYKVGQSYIGSSGDRMTAQADGSFYNERTGRVSVGSSQDSGTQWSSDSSSDHLPGFFTDQGRYVPGPTFGSAGVGFDATPGGVVTSGPGGSAGQVAVSTDGPRAGGSGAGSQLAFGQSGVWWDKAGKASAVPGSFVLSGALPPLQPVMKGDNTAIQIGGWQFKPHPRTSDASEIENMLGDGDNPFEAAWWFKQAAALTHADYNLKLWADDPATKQWAADFDAGAAEVWRGITWQK